MNAVTAFRPVHVYTLRRLLILATDFDPLGAKNFHINALRSIYEKYVKAFINSNSFKIYPPILSSTMPSLINLYFHLIEGLMLIYLNT
jgi:hypothetical protein